MQAIILRSRSINQDKFFQKDQSQKYKKHKLTLTTINKQKHCLVKEWQKEVQQMSSTLRKSKSAAKVFRQNQDLVHLKQSNMFLLKKIWNVQPSISTYNTDRFQYVSGSNWNFKKRKIEQIKQENKIIGKKVLMNQLQHIDYKKKLKQQIEEYTKLRDNIRKFKIKDSKPKRVKSERKQDLDLIKRQEPKEQKITVMQIEINPQIKS